MIRKPNQWFKAFEKFGKAITNISSEHSNIHRGISFYYYNEYTLSSGATKDIFIEVPSHVYPHFNGLTISATTAPLNVSLYEGSTVSDKGTVDIVYNMNRNSDKSNNVIFYDDPTIDSLGTRIDNTLVPGAKQSGGIEEDSPFEWILQQGTDYISRVTNDSTDEATIVTNIFFYESQLEFY